MVLELGHQVLVSGGELEDGGAGGAEGGGFLAGEYIVVFPVAGQGEGGGNAPEEVAFGVEPGGFQPGWGVELFELGVVGGYIGIAIVGEGGEGAVVLDFVFKFGECFDDALTFGLLFGVGAVGYCAVGVVYGLGLAGRSQRGCFERERGWLLTMMMGHLLLPVCQPKELGSPVEYCAVTCD